MRPPRHLLPGAPAAPRATGLLGQLTIQAPGAIVTAGARPSPAAAPAHRPSRAVFNKLMVSIMVIAAIGTLASGTFATFTAQTASQNNVIQTGTLALSEGVGANTCLSYGTLGPGNTLTNGNNNTGCAAFTFTNYATPNALAYANFTLQNVGSTDGLSLRASASSCTSAADAAQTYNGGGNVCNQLLVYIQEYTDATFTTATTSCAYPSGAAACSFGTNPQNLSSFMSASPNLVANGLKAKGAAGDTRYFRVAVQLPPTSNNTFQGMKANLTFTWELDSV